MSTRPLRTFTLGAMLALTALAVANCGSDDSPTTPAVTISAPGIVGPNSTAALAENPPTLTVTNATASDGSTPTYTFQVASDQAFADIVRQASGIPQGAGQTSWTLATALPSGEYFWRARAVASGVNGPFSAVARMNAGGVVVVGPGETILVTDPLTNGMTLGQSFGGTFTQQGWRVNTNADFIRYEVPTVSNGYVQWENVGLTPRGANEASHMLFGMWDPTAGAYRQNAFRVHLQKLWNNPHNPPFMRFRWISQGREHDAGHDFTAWDPAEVYTFRIDWGPAGAAQRARVFLDGQEIMGLGYNRPYQPNTHFIELGVGERGESVIDAVYRNFVVVKRGN